MKLTVKGEALRFWMVYGNYTASEFLLCLTNDNYNTSVDLFGYSHDR